MKIIHKFLIFGLVLTTLIGLVGYYAIRKSEVSLQRFINHASASYAQSVLEEIERSLTGRISYWQAYVKSTLVRNHLRELNQAFEAAHTGEDIDQYIDRMDTLWQQTAATEPQGLLQSLMNNDLANDLRAIGQEDIYGYDVYPEVFVTNRYGVNAAQTDRTSDYRQDDETWWQKAREDGQSISPLGFDESAGVYSVDLGLRVEDVDGTFLGVMKVVMNVREILDILQCDMLADFGGKSSNIVLFTPDKRIIHSVVSEVAFLSDGSSYFSDLLLQTESAGNDFPGCITVHRYNPKTGKTYLSNFVQWPGQKESVMTGWILLVEHEMGEVLRPLTDLRCRILVVASAAILVAFLVGLVIIASFQRRVAGMRATIAHFAKGHLWMRLDAKGSDELSELGRALNAMADDLDDANRQTSQALQQARDSAERAQIADRAKSQFLANMSHEMRTPLNSVIGFSELLREVELTDEQAEYADAITRSGEALLDSINDILDFCKIEVGEMGLENRPFDLEPLAREVCDMIKSRIQTDQIELICDLDKRLPDAVVGDRHRLRQVLGYLLSNAVKFTPGGKIVLHIHLVRSDADEAVLKFVVEDTGIGISPQKQAQIFEAFQQEDSSTTRRYGGIGLGLTICGRIVKLMNGDLQLNSEAGKGSTFWFTIRLGVPKESESPTATTQTNTKKKTNSEQTILVVDDNPSNQKLLHRLLTRAGYQVELADNGRIAVDKAAAGTFVVILMDVQMPEMNGLEATHAIRTMGLTEVPIIAVTANAFDEDRQQCLRAGMNDFIAKPFTSSVLLEKTRHWAQPIPANARTSSHCDATE